MGDLDTNLITEYANCPGLYDRNSPYYKDRMYITQTWNEISQKLGFEVNVLKKRVAQLRSRYHVEKKRIDRIQSQNPNCSTRSNWTLFPKMKFMDTHIKHRRHQRTHVKFCQQDIDNVRSSRMPNCSVPRTIDNTFVESQYESTVLPFLHDAKKKEHLARLEKYESFGKFLVSSLCDLSHLQAMKLVEKFTSDVVRSFVTTNNVPVSNGASTSNTQSNHNHHPVIQNVETVTKDEQHESLIPPVLSQNKSDSDELPTVKKNADETAVIPTSNSNSNNFEADEYDEDHFIYDLTEDDSLSF